jgi:c-di-GMP-binding flagellar brake protein YcgR
MSLLRAKAPSQTVEEIIGEGCARNIPAELQYEDRDGAIITGRVRLLELTKDHVLADSPAYLKDDGRIPTGEAITVHVLLNKSRYQFESVIEDTDQTIRLNARQTVPGIALCRPAEISNSQRRTNLRITMLGYDPINVDLVRPDPNVSDACSTDARIIAAWMIDLSVRGVSVIADRRVLASARRGQRFFMSFALPSVTDEFHMLGSVRHGRIVRASGSLRIGISLRPWRDRMFKHDQRRISQFIAEHERRMLRRRR